MKTLQFKTNIKCGGCVAQVTPALNEQAGKDHWSVDINDPKKILTVTTEQPAAAVIKAVKQAGFEAEEL
ncbi:heavy-metal-associated domain-containing protein [Filimonas effusa]|uniref:Heavy metal transport/detoxification protein n=1 Tax=Filimonas effusa TaxID=2508721 RepID=A0A4Q1DCA3_9BACT|nr:cation transporter [Filimonas effusa]RXK87087.1 heavy metal transport/detoxification protein [Filimonas effusa]